MNCAGADYECPHCPRQSRYNLQDAIFQIDHEPSCRSCNEGFTKWVKCQNCGKDLIPKFCSGMIQDLSSLGGNAVCDQCGFETADLELDGTNCVQFVCQNCGELITIGSNKDTSE